MSTRTREGAREPPQAGAIVCSSGLSRPAAHLQPCTTSARGLPRNLPVHMGPNLPMQLTAQQPPDTGESERSSQPTKVKAAGPCHPHQECPPFPKAVPCLRGRTGSTHIHRHTPSFPNANVASSALVMLTHLVCSHPAPSIAALQTLAGFPLIPWAVSLSTLLSCSFDDNHTRTHAHSPKVPRVCLSRNRPIQSPVPPTPGYRRTSAETLNGTRAQAPAMWVSRSHRSQHRRVNTGLAEAYEAEVTRSTTVQISVLLCPPKTTTLLRLLGGSGRPQPRVSSQEAILPHAGLKPLHIPGYSPLPPHLTVN